MRGVEVLTGDEQGTRSPGSLCPAPLCSFLVAVALGAVLHPLQFTLVQFLEGYWGVSGVAVRLRALRTAAYDRRRDYLLDTKIEGVLGRQDDDEALASEVRADEASRLLTYLPTSRRSLMPTRLGNVLRRYEMNAGSEYGLPVLVFAGHLVQVAPAEQVRYLNDQRTALDFAVKCCLVGIIGSIVAVIFLWQHGLWLALTTVPYMLAYGSYRGAVIVAHDYGKALEELVVLNRFALYERLRLKLPADTEDERKTNATLTSLTRDHASRQRLPYKHPETTNPDGNAPSPVPET